MNGRFDDHLGNALAPASLFRTSDLLVQLLRTGVGVEKLSTNQSKSLPDMSADLESYRALCRCQLDWIAWQVIGQIPCFASTGPSSHARKSL
jgi:hypothetical protein